MKNLFFILTTLISLSSLANVGGEGVGNGGGGLSKNNKVMTFHSAKFLAQSNPLNFNSIPGMDLLLEQLKSGKFLTTNYAYKIISLLLPNIVSQRAYYRVDENVLKENIEIILDKYVQITGFKKDRLVLFAITDPTSQATFLLPDFFKLTINEQAALLLHESLWLLDTKIDYPQVLKVESAFQAYLDAGSEPARYRLAKVFDELFSSVFKLKSYTNSVAVAIDADIQNKDLGVFAKRRINAVTFFGKDYLECLHSGDNFNNNLCNNFLKMNINLLIQVFPNSYFLNTMNQMIEDGGFNSTQLKFTKPISSDWDSYYNIMEDFYLDFTDDPIKRDCFFIYYHGDYVGEISF